MRMPACCCPACCAATPHEGPHTPALPCLDTSMIVAGSMQTQRLVPVHASGKGGHRRQRERCMGGQLGKIRLRHMRVRTSPTRRCPSSHSSSTGCPPHSQVGSTWCMPNSLANRSPCKCMCRVQAWTAQPSHARGHGEGAAWGRQRAPQPPSSTTPGLPATIQCTHCAPMLTKGTARWAAGFRSAQKLQWRGKKPCKRCEVAC